MVDAVSSAASAAAQQGSRASLTDNFETFLTLLTEQMKNQDPLSPLDSTQFVNQLVQFSGVEQQINQNQNLETLIGLQLAASQANAASYLGREVTVASPEAELADGQADWTYTLPRQAHTAKLLVTNSEGKLVYTANAQTAEGEHAFTWDGKDASGKVLPEGVYTLSVAALDADEEEIAASIRTEGEVTSVDFSSGEPLIFMGARSVSLSDILTLRATAPATVSETT